jgi:hypothetical protein
MAGEFKETPHGQDGERGLDRSWIAELWRAQTEKADPWKDSA